MTRQRGPSEPFTKAMVDDLRIILRAQGKLRDLALLELNIGTNLRACDLLPLKIRDIGAKFTVVQRKTGKRVKCCLKPEALAVVREYIDSRPSLLSGDSYLFLGKKGQYLSPKHYAKIVKYWVTLLMASDPKWRATLDPFVFGTHSLRKARPTQIFAETGNIIICRDLLGHTSTKHTEAYINWSVEKSHEAAERIVF
jgi:integrase